jgi:hypothetical protein
MTRKFSLVIVGAIMTCGLAAIPATTALADSKGKSCHMEQQCHWENFKKVCVWVKVCR